MNLTEFKAMWEEDGTHLVEEDRRQQAGATWILFSAEAPRMTPDYGRHYAVYVVLGTKGQIVAHNLKNLTSRDTTPWRQQVGAWWEEHVAEGLVDESGATIPI